MLKAWSEINYQENVQKREEIIKQILWVNSHIRIQNKPVFYEAAFDRGLLKIGQLIDLGGNWLSSAIIAKMFNMSVMEANSLIAAIPKQWKKILKTQKNNTSNPHLILYDEIKEKPRIVKWAYSKLNRNNSNMYKMFQKWTKNNECILDFELYTKAILAIRQISNFSKFRSFQYRLLSKALIFKNQLFRWGLTPDNKCTNCNKEKENLIHFYWSCPYAEKMWKWLSNYCVEKYAITPNIKVETIMTNIVHPKIQHPVNFICLLIKCQMYSYKCMNKELKTNHIEDYLEQCKRYELYNAQLKGKIKTHYKKWHVTNVSIEEIPDLEQEIIEYVNNISLC